ncbi:cadherin domain protein, partial [Teladorsagia circumcincta]
FSSFPSPSPVPTPPTVSVLPPNNTTSAASSSPRPLRLAPVFNPPQITVTADENEADIEIAKVHASYPDGGSGTISYVLHKGDPTLFAVSSYSGSVTLLRPLDAEVDTSYMLQISTAEDPNNRIRYRLVSAGGLENYFAVNGDTGLITLALQVDAFAGEKITLRIEASDSGVPSQSSMTNVLIDIAPSTSQVQFFFGDGKILCCEK